jgi:hypothetical protein
LGPVFDPSGLKHLVASAAASPDEARSSPSSTTLVTHTHRLDANGKPIGSPEQILCSIRSAWSSETATAGPGTSFTNGGQKRPSRRPRKLSLVSCTASGEHAFVCQAIHTVLLEQIVDCPAKQVLHRYLKIHREFPKLSAHLH